LQRLTSKEPSEDQLEVAIRALKEVLELESQSEALPRLPTAGRHSVGLPGNDLSS